MFETMRSNLRQCPTGTARDTVGKFGCRDVRMMMGLVDSSNNNEKFESQYP